MSWLFFLLVGISIPYAFTGFGDLYFIRPTPKLDHEFVCGNVIIPSLFLQFFHWVIGVLSTLVFYNINTILLKKNS